MLNWRVLVGDARETMAELPDASVQMVCTSPPYWLLRNYQVDGQIGQEPTPDAFVYALVSVFHEIKRVLRPDGTVWLNLGSTYLSQGGERAYGSYDGVTGRGPGTTRTRIDLSAVQTLFSVYVAALKTKDLVPIPWLVAMALQMEGWYLRSDIIISKPNPMPESVTDRPTKSHEYLLLLALQKKYFFDAEAISELASDAMVMQMEQGYMGEGTKDYDAVGVQNPSSVKARIIANARKRADRFGGNKHVGDTTKHSDGSIYTGRPMRNARSVWTITNQPYPEAHFATFPEALPERCIKAGSKLGDLVLDPFCGSGTTGEVAIRLGRHFVGIELNAEYAELARQRIGGAAPLFAQEQR